MKHKILISLLIINCTFLIADIRYVSKTGTSTPPYTSWETASDSIQKAVNICNNGDTVIVGNGIYKEHLYINTNICLVGSSMDSTVIDGTGLNLATVTMFGGTISGFNIIGKEAHTNNINIKGIVVGSLYVNLNIDNCRISNCFLGIYFRRSSGVIKNVIMDKLKRGIDTFCGSDTCKPKLYNSVILIDSESTDAAWYSFDGGQPTIINNVLITQGSYYTRQSASAGITYGFQGHKLLILKNNLISGFYSNLFGLLTDSSEVLNNVFAEKGVTISENWVLSGVRSSDKIRNNIFMKNDRAVYALNEPSLDFNLFWENIYNINSGYTLAGNNIIADPMLVKDTLGYTLKADYHLQKYSPAINKGDPGILDIDGSRSDMGVFGGPLGQKYTYRDLAPRNPQNFTSVYKDGLINLTWNKNSETDLYLYRIYRDTVENFIYDTSKIIAVTADSFYNDNTSALTAKTYYYKVTAIDSSYNQSPASEEIKIIVTGLGEMPPQIAEEYKLMQNYPNPFNPSTKITYRLKESGNVKLIVYNILGEIVQVLTNGYREKGYYEAEFTSKSEYIDRTKGFMKETPTFYGDISSGIYLYRIEVTGNGNKPVYMDMKKMILVK